MKLCVGTSVPVKCANTLAVPGVPQCGGAVLGACEQKIAVAIVLDKGDGTGVSFQSNWLL